MEGATARPDRVLIYARTGRDAELVERVMGEAGLACAVCDTVSRLTTEIEKGAGVAVLGDDVLDPTAVKALVEWLENQPVWSDFPLIVLAREDQRVQELVPALGPVVNVTLLERPVRIATLLSTTHAALRARRRQYEVRDLVDRLARADRHKDEFLAMLGHELRNPLGAISTAVALLRHEGASGESKERQAERIDRQVRHLSRMVDDLLDLSRLSRGKVRVQRAPLDLRDVARNALETLELTGRNSQHEVRLELADEPLPVEGDPLRLEQVVTNLLHNAVKYTPAGRDITIRLGREEGAAVVRVEDRGMGVEADRLESIFDPFTQLGEPLAEGEGGLGMGLYLARALVELHGGTITARSAGLGKGTELIVRLPLLAATTDLEQQGGERAGEDSAPFETRYPDPSPGPPGSEVANLRVLLVEDNAEAREALGELLELWGCRVDAAASGGAAVTSVARRRPDLALIDIHLPDFDGYEVARRLRREHSAGFRMVALTGFGQPEDRRRALAAGFDDHLVKPVDPQALIRLLQTVAAGAGPDSREGADSARHAAARSAP